MTTEVQQESPEVQDAGGVASHRPVDVYLVLWMSGLTLLWGVNAISIKVLIGGISPFMGAGLRGVVALVPLIIFGLVRGESFRFRGMEIVHVLVTGGIFTLEFVFFYSGAQYTNGGHMAIFINSAPFFVTLGAHFLLKDDRIHPAKITGLLVAFLGIVVLFSDELYIQKSGFWRGDLLVIGGAMGWAATTLYMKRYMVDSFSGFRMLFAQVVISTPILLGLSYWFEEAPFQDTGPLIIGNLLFQGLVTVFFSYLMWMVLLRMYAASSMQSFTFLSPVWGVLAGIILLSEAVSPLAGGGMMLVGLGLYLVNRPRGDQNPALEKGGES